MIELPTRAGKDDAASLLESADAAASDEPRAPSPYAAVDQGCPFVSTRRVAAADVSAPDWRTCSPAPR